MNLIQDKLPNSGGAYSWSFLLLVAAVWKGPATAIYATLATEAIHAEPRELLSRRVRRLFSAAFIYVLVLESLPLIAGVAVSGHLGKAATVVPFVAHAILYLRVGVALQVLAHRPDSFRRTIKRCVIMSRRMSALLFGVIAAELSLVLLAVPFSIWSEFCANVVTSIGTAFSWLAGAAIVRLYEKQGC